MKDQTAIAIAGMACVSSVYAVYIVTGAAMHTLAPDGVILSGVIGAVCALGGVVYAITGRTQPKG